jgi:hypothetical protein
LKRGEGFIFYCDDGENGSHSRADEVAEDAAMDRAYVVVEASFVGRRLDPRLAFAEPY